MRRVSLITCDRPYMVFRSLSHPRCLIYIPIGPKLAFYASPDPKKEGQLLAQNAKSVAKEMNRWQAVLAARFIYSADTHHGPLVHKWLRTA
jgi:Protein of unknown function (DUF4238)